jgi:tetratricopeptide (TPR) repeat protein
VKRTLPLLLLLAACGVLGGPSEQDRQNLVACQQRAKLYMEGQKYEQALDQIRRGLEIAPADYHLHTLRAWCRLYQSRKDPAMLDEAAREFEHTQALRSRSTQDGQTLLGCALVQLDLGQRELRKAEALQEERKRLDPLSAEAATKQAVAAEHVNRAHAYLANSENLLNHLLEDGDRLLLARYHLMQVRGLRRDYEGVKEQARAYLARSAQSQEYWRKDYESTSVSAYEAHAQRQLQRLVNEELAVRAYLANVHSDFGHPELAIEELDVVLRMDPTRSEEYYNRGLCHQKLGRHDEAAKDFQKFLATTRLPLGHPTVRDAVAQVQKR